MRFGRLGSETGRTCILDEEVDAVDGDVDAGVEFEQAEDLRIEVDLIMVSFGMVECDAVYRSTLAVILSCSSVSQYVQSRKTGRGQQYHFDIDLAHILRKTSGQPYDSISHITDACCIHTREALR